MRPDGLTVVQCWNDGVKADVRLIEILRKHNTRATFNLNAGLHNESRTPGWVHAGTEVWRLGWSGMGDV